MIKTCILSLIIFFLTINFSFAALKPGAGRTVGIGSSLFAFEQNGRPELEGQQGGAIMSCGQRMTPDKCFAAISGKKINEMCGKLQKKGKKKQRAAAIAKRKKCYCHKMITVSFPNEGTVQASIEDTGITSGGGNRIDLNGTCFNQTTKGKVDGRSSSVRNNTTWSVN